MKQLVVSESWLYRYRFSLGYLFLVAFGSFSLFFRLGNLLPGINEVEADTAVTSLDLGGIIERPINFIFHLFQYLSVTLLGPTPWALRVPGVLLTVVAIVLFYFIIEHRFTRRAALVTSLLLISSSWFLNTTRLANPSTLTILMILLLIFVATRLDRKYSLAWLLGLVVAAALSLYTAYFFYLLIAGVLVSFPTIKKTAKKVKNKHLYLAIGIFLALITPLVYSIIRDTSIAIELLAIPDIWPTPKEYLANLVDVVGHVIWRSTPEPLLHLGSLPMLEIFSVSMVALGLYHYDHELSKNLSRLVLGGLLISFLLLAVSADQYDFAILLPFVYFVLTGGLVILFSQWNEIFPNNPLARVLAIIPIAILLFIVGRYHMERYFVAWANNPEVVTLHSEAYVAINNELSNNGTYTITFHSANETIIMSPLSKFYSSTIFTDSIVEIASNPEERRLIITDNAYSDLSDDYKQILGSPSRIVPSQYPTHAAVLWVYDVSL